MSVNRKQRPRRKHQSRLIHPIILAAGSPGELPFHKALAPIGGKLALQRALETCAATPGLATPVVVLGCAASRVLAGWKKATCEHGAPGDRGTHTRAHIVRNERWRQGQLTSLLAGLRLVPRNAAFMIYPVDYPLISPGLLARLIRAYTRRARQQKLALPAMGGRAGHPVVVAPELRPEFVTAKTARDVIYRDPRRVLLVPVRDASIFCDFDTLGSYRLCLRLLRERARGASAGGRA
jgi:CTP:molybdopterin cytidylyltransferase MocA